MSRGWLAAASEEQAAPALARMNQPKRGDQLFFPGNAIQHLLRLGYAKPGTGVLAQQSADHRP